ncbi:MAG: DUF2723 domain-containing protein [Chloroflexota bacterium]|nr:DUF2723 domain-containing protein [Chloroflexota bacterium]
MALYVATAARDIVFGDTPELTAVAVTLGVAHPPGYPIFTMLGWLFSHLPVGPVPFRVTLLSVVSNAATVGVIYVTTFRFTRSIPAAAVAAVALATEPAFWAWSLVTEVFPLNDLLSATMLLFVALWHEHPERKWLLVAGGLAGGLGMANHQTIALLSPAVFYVMWRRRAELQRDVRTVVNAGIAFLVGLVPYVELLFAAGRHPVWSWGDLRSPSDLLAHFLRQSYGTASLIVGGQFTGGSPVDRLTAFFATLDPLQWILLAAGAAFAWRAKRWYATYLLIGFVIAGPLFAVYSNANISDDTTLSILERFFLMPHAVVMPLAGFAVVAAGEAARRLPLARRPLEMIAAAVAVVVALAFVPLHYGEIDRSSDHTARTFGNDLMASTRQNAIFMVSGDPVVYSVLYLQSVEGQRPDLKIFILPLVSGDWYIREFKRLNPDVVVPDATYGTGTSQIKSFFDANLPKRPIDVIGQLPDQSTSDAYWFYSHGLVYQTKKADEKVTLEQMSSDNEALVSKYHQPRYSDLSGPYRSWERLSLVDYALAYYRVGNEYEKAADGLKTTDVIEAKQLYAIAKDWYQRALQVNPTVVEAVQGLARVSQ